VRFFKVFSIIIVTLLIILTVTYSARVALINYLAKAQLDLEQINITCLDINLARNISIVINKLCIESPKADIEVIDMEVQWQYSPIFQINDINTKLVSIKGTDHLFSNTTKTSQSNQLNKSSEDLSLLVSTTLRPYIEQIKQFKLPTKIDIAKVSYLPFTVNKKSTEFNKILIQQNEITYAASILAVNNTFSFSLRNADNIEFIKTNLTQKEKGFSITLSSKLNLLKKFATTHQLPITKELQNDLKSNEISGNVDLLIKYQADVFSLQSKVINISIESTNGIGQSGALNLSGTLNFNSNFTLMSKEDAKEMTNKASNNAKSEIAGKYNSKIALEFIGKNEIFFKYSQPPIIKLLEKNQLSPTVISIVKDNPLKYIKLMVKGSGTLTLNDQKGYLSHIEISAYNNKLIHQVKLDNITIKTTKSSSKEKKTSYTKEVERFTIDSQLNSASITKLTTAPIVLHLEGNAKITDAKTLLNLTEQSTIKVENITAITTTEKQAKAILNIKALTTTLSGNVQRLKNNDLNIDLTVHNKASQLNVPKTLKINSLSLLSHIKGNLDDININTSVSADNVYLGDVTISGRIQAPKVKVAAEKLQLTELLSLNIQLPASIALIDGTLTYSLSGELTSLSNIENTLFNASFSIKSLSGDIDEIWIQELNWQESLILQAGKISTKPSIDNNLTIALIETFTPVSKISMNTDWAFNEDFTFSANKLSADIFSGSVSVPTLKWPFEHGHSANVHLSSIDLAQVLALDKKQGIVVTGNISGELPIVFDGEKYMIEQGELHNVSNGLIQVINNPAVDALKANNSQLQLAFDALQNLHYHQLSSEVSMADDGYMQLDTIIKGRNPTIDNDVNLNLNISYDLLGLLESLSITQRFEENIIKGLQKNKE
jgi:hypothetical protein